MKEYVTALIALFDRTPRRHSLENVKEINAIVNEYEEVLIKIEAINADYEKKIAPFFSGLDTVKASIKMSNDNKASKKNKDVYFDEASGALKDDMQAVITLCNS